MIGRRALIGLCALCALFVSAFAAQGASAATKGTTAFTCRSDAPVLDLKTEHCVEGESGTAFGHVKIEPNTTTHFTATNEKTNAATNGPTNSVLKSTVAGSAIELVATGVHATGGLENKTEANGEHYVHGHEVVIKYTGVTEKLLTCDVIGKPGGKGTVETNKLTSTTAGQAMGVKFQPEGATPFAEFELKDNGNGKCVVAPITIKVVGTIKCNPSGATINCNHNEVTASKTLRLQSAAGPIAGYEGSVTVTGSHSVGEEPTKPLSATTIETP